jgi:predicted ATPase/DNA-binding CsgD family transcriptional regulator
MLRHDGRREPRAAEAAGVEPLTVLDDPAEGPLEESLAVLVVGRARTPSPSDGDPGPSRVTEGLHRAAAQLSGAAFRVDPHVHGLSLPRHVLTARTLGIARDLVDPAGAHAPTDGDRWAVHVGAGSWRTALTSAEVVVERAAALCAVAHPGQVVMTDAARSSIERRTGLRLADLGTHRLPDLGAPERVWQLGTTTYPPLRSLDPARHDLPSVLTPLTGRSAAVAEVVALLGRERLVTLTGSAGVGKTRLATAVAARVAVVVDLVRSAWLGAVTDADGVDRVVLEAFGLGEASGDPLPDQVAAAVGERRTLLVLDGCEQVRERVVPLVLALLSRIPALSILATGLEPLGVTGEVTWRVPSLTYPHAGAPLGAGADDLITHASARLFVDRASRARPGLVLRGEPDVRAVADICRRLDGIPLAIELAAAHCRHLPVTEIATQLRRHFRLLEADTPAALARYRTLAASLDWSHDRLSPLERTVFRRLAPFASRFPLEAAQQVVAAPGDLAVEAVLDGLNALVDRSLLVQETHEALPGYRLLGTVRALARERAGDAGELDALRDAHARWWTAWLARLSREPVPTRLAEVDRWIDELLQALTWSTRRPAEALTLLDGLARTALEIGRAQAVVTAARPLLTAALAEQHPDAWLEAASTAVLRYDLGRAEDLRDLRQLVDEVAGRRGEPYHRAVADFLLGIGPQPCEALVAAATARDEPWTAALAACVLVEQTAAVDPSRVAAPTADAERRVRRTQSPFLAALLSRAHGRAARDLGRWEDALLRADHLLASRSVLALANGLDLTRQVGLLTASPDVLDGALATARRSPSAGQVAAEVAELRHARGLLDGTEGSRVDPRSAGVRPIGPGSLWLICREALDAGDPEAALGVAARNRWDGPFGDAVQAALDGAAHRDPERWAAAGHAAADLGLVVVAVDALEGLAVLTADDGHPAEAVRLLSTAESVRTRVGYAWRFPAERDAVARLRAALDLDVAVAVDLDVDMDADVAGGYGPERNPGTWRDDVEAVLRGRGPRDRPRFGWQSLTPTELRVVEMVAEGLTNPQIALRLRVGRATVKSHLDNVFAKLGVHSRARVAAEHARHC